jgi:hypothetical protein
LFVIAVLQCAPRDRLAVVAGAPWVRGRANAVLFAPHADESTEQLISDIYVALERDLLQRQLSAIVPIDVVPSGVSVTTHDDASRLLHDTGRRNARFISKLFILPVRRQPVTSAAGHRP